MPDSDKANLARIRDNQRRSRARRKEYLQEVEGRLRLCELAGVEASSEIQSAARKVIEENRRLRRLLARHSVSPDDTSDEDGSQQYGDDESSMPKSENALALETLLSIRRWKCLEPLDSPPATTISASTMTSNRNPGGVTASSKATQVSWPASPVSMQDQVIALPESTGMGLNAPPSAWSLSVEDFQSQGLHQLGQDPDSCTPGSSYSFTNQAASVDCRPTSMGVQQTQQQPHQPQIPSVGPPGTCNMQYTTATYKEQSTVYDYASQAPLDPNQFRHVKQQQALYDTAAALAYQQPPQPHQIQLPVPPGPSFQPPGYVTSSAPAYNTNTQAIGTSSCIYATDLISVLAGDALQSDVRTDLGCIPQQCGTDCQVSNQIVFNVMDRYSGIR